MITRVWQGWTAPENADAYERFLLGELFPSLRSIGGFLSAELLRRDEGDEVGFVALTRFDSVDSIRAFAGDDVEKAAIEPTAAALLAHYEPRARHYETHSP